MGLFKNNKRVGLINDVIRCDEPSYLIWKWHPDGTAPGEHGRENSIRFGSRLRVKEGEVAVFVYRQKNGTLQDFLVGPRDEKLTTANLPILSGIIGAFIGGDTPFQAEVYFINLAQIIQTRFAVPYFDVHDPRYPDFTVPIAVRGTISFKIKDYKEFIKLHRLIGFDLEDFQRQIRDAVSRYVKNAVANAPTVHNVPVVQIESKVALINSAIEHDVSTRLGTDFGVTVSAVDISALEIDKSDDGYRQLMAITKDITTATIQAQTAANIENYAETLRIQREESQYAARKKTQTDNLAAYRVEAQTAVGIAGAEALGQMGTNGAGSINLGADTGFNPAAMMASMAVGGAVGQNIASVMNSTINTAGAAPVPPPIPTLTFYVAQNGNPTGPFDLQTLAAMVAAGTLLPDTLVWTQGMQNWEKANTVSNIASLFPPKIP